MRHDLPARVSVGNDDAVVAAVTGPSKSHADYHYWPKAPRIEKNVVVVTVNALLTVGFSDFPCAIMNRGANPAPLGTEGKTHDKCGDRGYQPTVLPGSEPQGRQSSAPHLRLADYASK